MPRFVGPVQRKIHPAMSTSTGLDALTDFFSRYGSALTAGDVPAIAECYAMPATLVSDSYSFSFSSPAAVALSFVQVASDYQDRELVAAHAQILDVRRLSEALVLVAVEWEYLDSRGQAVPGEPYQYLLRRTHDTFAICTVIHGRDRQRLED